MSNSDYDEFMVYELDDSGERVRLEGITIDTLESILHPEQVVVIVREDLRRIYIWKGVKSPVRQRFISSRVAQQLQEELVKVAAFHRCKIVSIDQGDELEEFLKAFNLESMEVTDKMQDLRYVRNIEKQGGLGGKVLDDDEPEESPANVQETEPVKEKGPEREKKAKPKASKPAPKIQRKVESSKLQKSTPKIPTSNPATSRASAVGSPSTSENNSISSNVA